MATCYSRPQATYNEFQRTGICPPTLTGTNDPEFEPDIRATQGFYAGSLDNEFRPWLPVLMTLGRPAVPHRELIPLPQRGNGARSNMAGPATGNESSFQANQMRASPSPTLMLDPRPRILVSRVMRRHDMMKYRVHLLLAMLSHIIIKYDRQMRAAGYGGNSPLSVCQPVRSVVYGPSLPSPAGHRRIAFTA
ncbi:hypothetical protein OUZ56_032103 [Daphnia magna]|uniref:Uncharacterized protein n=1 Tax=Daphnia magna TaxID=35525 RepID=A0ABQ9ZW56_9CRUS|nr:hypothetical protein OUZ56_032103 [Daphnia magna]